MRPGVSGPRPQPRLGEKAAGRRVLVRSAPARGSGEPPGRWWSRPLRSGVSPGAREGPGNPARRLRHWCVTGAPARGLRAPRLPPFAHAPRPLRAPSWARYQHPDRTPRVSLTTANQQASPLPRSARAFSATRPPARPAPQPARHSAWSARCPGLAEGRRGKGPWAVVLAGSEPPASLSLPGGACQGHAGLGAAVRTCHREMHNNSPPPRDSACRNVYYL